MEEVLLFAANVLRDLAEGIEQSVTSGSRADQATFLGIIGALIGFILAGTRMILRWLTRHDEKRAESLRAEKRKTGEAEAKLAAVRERNDELRGFDPSVFLGELKQANDGGVLRRRLNLSASFVEPLRPALGKAFTALGQEALAQAGSLEDLVSARQLACGAVAATPEASDAAQLLAAVEEALEDAKLDTISSDEALVWSVDRTGRDGPALMVLGDKLADQTRYRTAQAIFARAEERFQMSEGQLSVGAIFAEARQADMLGELGYSREAYERMKVAFERAVAHPDLGSSSVSTFRLGRALLYKLHRLGQSDEMGRLAETVLAQFRNHPDFGPDHPETLSLESFSVLSAAAEIGAEAARAQLENVLERQERASDRIGVRQTLSRLAKLHHNEADYEGEADVLERLLSDWPEEGLTARARLDRAVSEVNRADALGSLGHHEKAAEILSRVWKLQSAPDMLGPGHPTTLATGTFLGRELSASEEWGAAADVYANMLGATQADPVRGRQHDVTHLAISAHVARCMAEGSFDVEGLDRLIAGHLDDHPNCIQRFRFSLDRARLLDARGDHAAATVELDALGPRLAEAFPSGHAFARAWERYIARRPAVAH